MTSRNDVGVVVAIATYRRPATVTATVIAVLAQVVPVSRARILIVDNDADGSARAVIAALDEARVTYVVEARPGIAAARNRALDLAGNDDVLVFIDDDETPESGWLKALLNVWSQTRPAAVAGPVRSEFEHEPDAWIRAGGFFERRRPATGTVVRVAATNNLLLDIGFVRAHGLRFDQRFGLSGGSDTLFTAGLSAAGGQIVWCAEAGVVDHVPAARLTRRWVLARSMRYGDSAARVRLAAADGPVERLRVRATIVALGSARLVAGSTRCAAGSVLCSVGNRARGARTAMRGIGYLRAAVGRTYIEYRR